MRRLKFFRRTSGSIAAIALFAALLWSAPLESAPTTAEQAARVVQNWLSLETAPMGVKTGDGILRTETHSEGGAAAYYIVHLDPRGFVVVPADDLVEPIVGFFPNATGYDPSDKNPAGALIHRDVPGRVASVRRAGTAERMKPLDPEPKSTSGAQNKWRMLESGEEERSKILGLSAISDVRVAPLIESAWGQSKAAGANCYNYYTPNNYPSGCVATAMAQIMRYHRRPVAGVGTHPITISVDDVEEIRNLRGGDGSGGAYDWNSMPLKPGSSMTTAQRRAIGALTHDAGVSVNMNYTSEGSGTDTLKAGYSFMEYFGYSNAVPGWNEGSNIPNLYPMINPNLDASYPVLLGITGSPGGHAIVGDGYGYNLGTMYHHLNMGWSGTDDAWYNLPVIETHSGDFDTVYKCVYNIFPTETGEIISGRVTTSAGVPIAGATVTLSGDASRTATTNAKGIYAFAGVDSGGSYTVSVARTGYTFTPSSRPVKTGWSPFWNTRVTGNRWQIDFSSGSTATSYDFLLHFGRYGWEDGEFGSLYGIALNSAGEVYVTDPWHNGILKFSPTGDFLETEWEYGDGGGIAYPTGIAVDRDGNIYVADWDNHSVQKFSSSGVFLAKWGSQGSGDGQFESPFAIAVDNDGNVYVTDTGNMCVQKFTSSGRFLAKWGSVGYGGFDANDGTFDWPYGIAVDSEGNVYVTDFFNNRVQKFSSDGAFITKWGGYGSEDGQFDHPYAIAVDTERNVYVTDYNNRRVQKFSSSGAFLGKWGSQGSGDGQFDRPFGIAVNDTGNVYVTDHSSLAPFNNRVQIFVPTGSKGSVRTSIDGPSTARWSLDGAGSYESGVTVFNIAVGSRTVSFSDVPGWTRPANRTVSVLRGKTSGTEGTYTRQQQEPKFPDFNGDGKADLLWQELSTGRLSVWYMNNAARSASATPSPSSVGGSWRPVGTGDFNGDGKTDILWQDFSTGRLSVWYMNGVVRTGSATPNPGSVSGSWRIVAAQDMNGDGKPDIIWQELSTGRLSVWYMDGVKRTGSASLNPGIVGGSWRIAGNSGAWMEHGVSIAADAVEMPGEDGAEETENTEERVGQPRHETPASSSVNAVKGVNDDSLPGLDPNELDPGDTYPGKLEPVAFEEGAFKRRRINDDESRRLTDELRNIYGPSVTGGDLVLIETLSFEIDTGGDTSGRYIPARITFTIPNGTLDGIDVGIRERIESALASGTAPEKALLDELLLVKLIEVDDDTIAFDLAELVRESGFPPEKFFSAAVEENACTLSLDILLFDGRTKDSAKLVRAADSGRFIIFDGEKDGKYADPLVLSAARASNTPSRVGGGGCSSGSAGIAAALLLLPLAMHLVLKKR